MIAIMSHPEWKLNSDNKTIELKRGRDSFMGTIHNMSTLTANGLSSDEYYLKVNYTGTGGAKVYEAKQQRFKFY